MKTGGFFHELLIHIGMFLQQVTFDKILLCVAVIVIFMVAVIIYFKEDKETWRRNAPSIITTIGIFCTFLGVTIGLMRFDPDQTSSLHFLLAGLKLAFLPSAFAVFLAIGFKWLSSSQHSGNMMREFLDKTEKNTQAIKKLADAISVVDWQVQYKERLEINVDRNAELLGILENSLSQLLSYLANQPKNLEESIEAVESAVREATNVVKGINGGLEGEIGKLIQGVAGGVNDHYAKSQNDIQALYQEISKLKLALEHLKSETSSVVNQIGTSLNDISFKIEKTLAEKLDKILMKVQEV